MALFRVPLAASEASPGSFLKWARRLSLRSDSSSVHFHKTLCDLSARCLGPAGLEQRVNSGKGRGCVIYHRASPSLRMHSMAIKRQSVRLRGLFSDLSKESVCSS